MRRLSVTRFIFVIFVVMVPIFLYFFDKLSQSSSIVSGIYCSETAQQGTVNRYTEVSYDHVVNPHNFSFLIAEEGKCRTEEDGVYLLVIIHSSPVHSNLRKIQRKSTLSEMLILGKRIVVVYMLGLSKDHHINGRVKVEAEEYHDIILGDYIDAYHNLTRKFMMGMKWASRFCSNAQYILKGDDDVYFNLRHIVGLLETAPSTNYMAGYVYKDATPYRIKHSKWFISETAYPHGCYPPFCRGYAYLLSGDLPSKLFDVALMTPFFPLDDVFVGFLAKKLGVTPTHTLGFRGPGGDGVSFCELNLTYATHVRDSKMITSLWEEQQSESSGWSCSRLIYFLRSIF